MFAQERISARGDEPLAPVGVWSSLITAQYYGFRKWLYINLRSV